MTGNAPPKITDETMGDDTKDLKQFLQKGLSAAEPEGALAVSMDETMDCDLVAPTVNTPTLPTGTR